MDSSSHQDDLNQDYEDLDYQVDNLALKLLFTNQASGVLIGKGGQTIRSFMEESGASIKLASHNELFPGTVERVALLQGSFDQICSAFSSMWNTLANSGSQMDEFVVIDDEDNEEAIAKVLVPSSIAGLIIGKRGASIQAMGENFGVRLQMSSRDEGLVTIERILRIRGSINSVIGCIEGVLDLFSSNSSLSRYRNLSTIYSKKPQNFKPLPTRRGGGGDQSSSSSYPDEEMNTSNNGGSGGGGPSNVTVMANTQVTIGVREEDIGAVLGKGGAMIAEIQRASGARVTVSQREEFQPGSNNRIVTIEGPPPAAETAQLLVMRCVEQHQRSRQRNSQLYHQRHPEGGDGEEDRGGGGRDEEDNEDHEQHKHDSGNEEDEKDR